MASRFANNLLQDMSRLFDASYYYDVLIEVGENDERETFKAHSSILVVRSSCFKVELSSNSVKKENDKFILVKPKISPKVFRKILK